MLRLCVFARALLIVWPRLRKPAPHALAHAELRRLLKTLEEPDELTELQRWVWARNRRAVLLMLFAGLRISEAAALCWREVGLALSAMRPKVCEPTTQR